MVAPAPDVVAVAPASPAPRAGGRVVGFVAANPTMAVGGAVVVLFALAAILAPWLTPFDPVAGVLTDRLQAPSWMGGPAGHLLGTDALGRDLLSRIVYGARISLGVGLATVAVAGAVGTILGLAAGWAGGWLDRILSRLADFLLAFPMLIFAIGVMTVLGAGFWVIVVALSFKSWVEFYRLVRAETLAQRELEYVQAARALGRPAIAILGDEILPNLVHTILVLATLRVGYFIIMEASLSFLGLGIQPPTPAWGSMVADGRDYMLTAWWISMFPGIAIVLLVLGINLLGEGMRDTLDPRLRKALGARGG